MGLSIGGVTINLELYIRGFYKGSESVFDMGAQDLHVNLGQFKELLSSAGITDYDESAFSVLAEFPQKRMGTEVFYKLLGFKKYLCSDVIDRWNSVKIDLNYPITGDSLLGKYDLVTDYGNNEHVFNIAEAYRTMHRLCKAQGIMIIQQQVYGGNGYYNFTPHYFEDMAIANEYEILFSLYEFNNHFIPIGSNIMDIADKQVALKMCYVFRKVKDQDFVFPCQGFITSKLGTGIYKIQYLPERNVRSYARIIENFEKDLSWVEILAIFMILVKKMKSVTNWSEAFGILKGKLRKKLKKQ